MVRRAPHQVSGSTRLDLSCGAEVDPFVRSRSRLLRCSPAGVDVGSDRRHRSDSCSGASAFQIFNIYCFVDCGACGYVGKGEHFLAFRARSGSAAGRQRRSSTYPQTEALYERMMEQLPTIPPLPVDRKAPEPPSATMGRRLPFHCYD